MRHPGRDEHEVSGADRVSHTPVNRGRGLALRRRAVLMDGGPSGHQGPRSLLHDPDIHRHGVYEGRLSATDVHLVGPAPHRALYSNTDLPSSLRLCAV